MFALVLIQLPVDCRAETMLLTDRQSWISGAHTGEHVEIILKSFADAVATGADQVELDFILQKTVG